MDKKRICKIIIVMCMLITIMLTQEFLTAFCFITYAWNTEYYDNTTNSNYIDFLCKLNQEEQPMNSSDMKLIVKVALKQEGIFKGKVTLEDSNFKFKEQEIEGIKRISDNAILINNLNEAKEYEYQLDIEPIKDDKYLLTNLNKESTIKLDGMYQVGYYKTDINATKKVSLKLKNPFLNFSEDDFDLKTKIITNNLYEINGEQKRVVQLAIQSGVINNAYPIKETIIGLKAPESVKDVKILSRGTYATNGETKEEFDSENINYDSDKKSIMIRIKNEEKEGYINWRKDSKDKLIANLIFDEDVDLSEENIIISGRIDLYDDLSNVTKTLVVNDLLENKENIIDYNLQPSKNDLYKGKLYSNEETEFENISTIDITYNQISNEIEFEEGAYKYQTEDENIQVDAHVLYKSSKINKEKLIKVLGNTGKLLILDSEGKVIETIDKDTSADENGDIVVTYQNNKNLIVKILDAESTGKIEIKNTISLKEEYDKETLKELTKLTIDGTLRANNLKQEFKANTDINLQEGLSRAKLRINNKNLSVAEENKNVYFNIMLYGNNEIYNLYKNPTFDILVPEEIENININNINILYDEYLNANLENVRIDTIENRKVIHIDVTGEQKTHLNSKITKGANIILNCNIDMKDSVNKYIGEFIMKYTNENEENYYENAKSILKVNYIIPEEEKEETVVKVASENSQVLQVTKEISSGNGQDIYQRQVQEYKIVIKNTGNTALTNLTVIDTIPEEMTYAEGIFNHGYQNTYIEDETKTQINETIETLEPGESKVIKYLAIPKKVSTNIGKTVGTKATVKIGEETFESNLVSNTIRENNLELWLITRNDPEEEIFSEDAGPIYLIRIKNLSNQVMQNVQIKDYIPNGMEYNQASYLSYDNNLQLFVEDSENLIENDGYNENEKSVTWNIENLAPNEQKVLKLALIHKKAEEDDEKIIRENQVTATVNGQEIKSNIIKTQQQNEGKLTINLTSTLNDTYLYEGTEFEYIAIVSNTSSTQNITFELEDILPEGIFGKTIKYDEQTINISDKALLGLSLNPKESKEIRLKVQAEDLNEDTQELEIKNYLTATGENVVTTRSNELVNIIRKNPNNEKEEYEIYNPDENQSQDQNTTPGENTIQDENTTEDENTVEDTNSSEEQNQIDDSSNNTIDDNDTENDTDTNEGDDNGSENGDGQDIDKEENDGTHSISGVAWLDENKNGSRDSGETLIKDVEVSVIHSSTGEYVEDDDGDVLTVHTNENGEYKIEDLDPDQYMVVFVYDDSLYSVTEYKKEGVNEKFNSDALENKGEDDEDAKFALTNIINLTQNNAEYIDIGLIKNATFDLKLDKYVSNIKTIIGKETKNKNFNQSELAKMEFKAKTINQTNIEVEYTLKVTNEGEIPGYAKKIIDYIPNGLEFDESRNKDWKASNGVLVYTGLNNIAIPTGESKEVKLILTKKMNENSFGTIINRAEISESYNDRGISDSDSIAGNNKDGEDDLGSATLILGLKTGKALRYTFEILLITTIMGIGIYFIKKKVLDDFS